MDISARHLKAGVSKLVLQADDVTAMNKVLRGRGMAQQMRVQAGNARKLADLGHHVLNVAMRKRISQLAEEEMLDGVTVLVTRAHERLVGQQCFVRSSSQVDDALLLPFPHHLHIAILALQVHVLKCQTAQFPQP
jgi:hypothetical protein